MEVLRIAGVGMGLVFAAMALVLVAMVLLTRLRDAEPQAKEAKGEGTPKVDERAIKFRVAMIAAAIARARSQDRLPSATLNIPPVPATANLWWAHHHVRQLDPARRFPRRN